jgi:hypothetical protein
MTCEMSVSSRLVVCELLLLKRLLLKALLLDASAIGYHPKGIVSDTGWNNNNNIISSRVIYRKAQCGFIRPSKRMPV